MKSKNNVAVITGGASGLGYATAEIFIAAGIKVVLLDLNEEAGQQAVENLGSDNAIFLAVDVTDSTSTESSFQKIINIHKNIHICVNCAGVAPAKKVLNREGSAMPLNDFAKVININLIGSFNIARLAAHYIATNEPLNKTGERGVIINTASVAAYEGQIGQSAYAASKGGIVSLTLPMARELATQGIRVNTIAPGIMGTPMLLAMPNEVQQSLSSNIPFPKRMGLPEEFGRLALHIVENTYINGETIRLDGGIRMQPR